MMDLLKRIEEQRRRKQLWEAISQPSGPLQSADEILQEALAEFDSPGRPTATVQEKGR